MDMVLLMVLILGWEDCCVFSTAGWRSGRGGSGFLDSGGGVGGMGGGKIGADGGEIVGHWLKRVLDDGCGLRNYISFGW